MAPERPRQPLADWSSAASPRVLLLGTLLLTAAVFVPTLGFGFVYDDHWVILDNGFLRSGGDALSLLTPDAWARHVPDAFRPVSVWFEMVVYAIVGLSEIGQHAVSVALFVTLVWLVVRWLQGLGAPLPVRIAAAAVFGTMAIHGEAVAVVSYREDLLAAVLAVGAMICADRAVDADPGARGRAHRLRFAGAAVMLGALAGGAKLSAAPIAILWLLARALAPWRPAPRRVDLALGTLALASAIAIAIAVRHQTLGAIDPYGPSERVLASRIGWTPVWAASVQIHLEYLRQMVVPTDFSPDYVDFGASWRSPTTVVCAAGLAGVLAIGAVAARGRRAPIVALAILGAFALALPTSNLAPLPTMRADRFMLLPSLPVAVGLAVAALRIGAWLGERFADTRLTMVPLVALVVVQGAALQGATAAYRSDTRLWSVAMARAPHSARAHGVYGELMIARLGRRPEPMRELNLRIVARTHCVLAAQLDPRDPIGDLCLGRLAAIEQQWREAYDHIEAAAARMSQRQERAWLALASLALDLPDVPYPKRLGRAFAHLERARREHPYVAEVFAVSGRIHHRLGHPDQAREDYRRARDLRPERWDIILAGLELELDLGHASAALATWSEARTLLRHADPIRRAAVRRRLDDALALFDPRPSDSE